ncbi:MAG TPA: M48 family metalloprotease [Steroidobacteraceae bacterium]|jgi:predicted Zn-dependent protease|nr:M48 family metalloprotease [Steroidobacteraceae bacterium]
MPGLASAKVLDTGIEALIGPGYEPVDKDERGMWQSLEQLEDAIKNSPKRLDAPKFDAYTRGVVERLVERPVPDLRIYVIHDAAFNAGMFPNGMMIVNTGLAVRIRNEAQFAAVLGHEAGHYFRKHQITQYRSVRRKSAASAFFGTITAIGGVGLAGSALNVALLTSMFQFSRTQETEADAFGIKLMSRAGYTPSAASEVWKQVIEERKASAKLNDQKYKDASKSAFSTHPATDERMVDLKDTAAQLAAGGNFSDHRDEWVEITREHMPMLLEEQISLNDAGASLYILQNLAQDGWTGLLRYNEGEVYRLRAGEGDADKAAAAYATAITLPDAPPEAWRAHGYALLKAGKTDEGKASLNKYLELNPTAKDGGMVRFTLTQ